MAKFLGAASTAAEAIVEAFANPTSLPKPLAQMFLDRNDDTPCSKWSWRNRFLVALHGFSDARGFRQWHQVGRQVKRGEKAFYILSPCTRTAVDQETGEKKQVVFGFKGTPVFGLEQTEGDPLPAADPDAEKWL